MTKRIAIYEPSPRAGTELCMTATAEATEILRTEIKGVPRQANWTPLPVYLAREDMGRKLTESDSPSGSIHFLVLRRRAVEALEPMLRAYGELLPLICEDADLLLYNPTHFRDALDEARSNVARFDDGRLVHVWTYVLHREAVANAVIFRLPNLTPSPILVGQPFVDRWKAAGLRGLNFKKIWSSD
jgi:uncharacterized protein DUF1629